MQRATKVSVRAAITMPPIGRRSVVLVDALELDDGETGALVVAPLDGRISRSIRVTQKSKTSSCTCSFVLCMLPFLPHTHHSIPELLHRDPARSISFRPWT